MAAPTRRRRLSEIVARLWRELHDDGLFDTAAGVAFWLLLSIPAALLATLSSVSLLGENLTRDLQASVNEFIDRTFTTESSTIRDAVNSLFDQSRPGVLSVSVVVAVFTLSRGFAGLIRALDVAYDVDEGRRFFRLRVTAIAMALGTMMTIAISTALWVWLRSVGVPGPLRVLLALTILIIWAATLFHVGPHHRTPWRFDLPGAAFAAVGWLMVSVGFGFYVRIAVSGNEIVGAAGTALLALTWLWIVCLIFLIGAELNEILAARAGVVSAPRELGVDVRGRITARRRR
ncbi:MAG: YihY/virulence factor BrkB family protein [Actinomycetota bacterium]|jgi:membrane protein|uniref:YihY/virulence factor BrkB family protein n=1 Tax=uncultured Ilumatobacter sp. TaxID=879968 RepID=UPI00374EEE5B|nr:YihY/virulence factor BrkB family protein [Actinomycetota bacterium]